VVGCGVVVLGIITDIVVVFLKTLIFGVVFSVKQKDPKCFLRRKRKLNGGEVG